MAETINVVTVQKDLNDLTDVRDVDRHDLLSTISNNAPKGALDLETMLGFDNMFRRYIIPPDVNSVTDVIINYLLSTNASYDITIKLDLKGQGKNIWEYYLPKEPSTGSMRLELPVRYKATVIPSERALVFPQGQSLDLYTINKQDITNKEGINNLLLKIQQIKLPTFTPPPRNKGTKINIKGLIKDKNKVLPLQIPFIKKIKSFGININSNVTTMEQFIANVLSMDLKSIYINYLKNKEGNLEGEIWSKYLSAQHKQKESIKLEALKTKETTYRNTILNIIRTHYPLISVDYNMPINNILNSLKTEEKEYVLSVYQSYNQLGEGKKNNNCPHLNLYFKLRNSPKPNIAQIYNSLVSYISDDKVKDKYIVCKNCKFNLACPHVIELINLRLKYADPKDVLEAMEKYIDKSVTSFLHFCKICHEELPKHTDYDIQEERYIIGYEILRKKVWGNLLITYNTLKFSPLVNIYDFAATIANTIIPVIINTKNVAVQNEINVYNTTEEISGPLDIYIWIFIYTYLLHIIRENLANPDPKNVKINTVEDVKNRKVSSYGEVLINRFSTKHRGLLAFNKDINIEESFKQIFADLAILDIPFYIERLFTREKEVYDFMSTNTYYKYSVKIARYIKYISADLPTSITRREYEGIIEKIVGKEINELIKMTNVCLLQNIKIPIPIGTTDNIIYTYSLYRKWFNGEKVDMTPLQVKDREIRKKELLKWVAPTKTTQANKKYKKRSVTDDNRLTAIINESGYPHKWDIIILEGGKELPRGSGIYSILKGTPNATQPKILDYKSSKTGQKRSETKNNDIKKTLTNYLKVEDLRAFYQHYSILCPEDGLHIFNNSGECSKCKLVKTDTNKDNEYYSKYYKSFKDDMTLVRSTATVSPTLPTGDIYKVKSWSFNKISTIEVSQLVEIPEIVFFYVGCMGGYTYQEMVNGKVPQDYPKPTSIQDTKIHITRSHLLNIISLYNMSKFGINDDPDYKKLFTNVADLAYSYKDAPLDIYQEFSDRIHNFYMLKIDPHEAFLMLIQTICDFIMKVHKLGEEKYEKLAKYLINTVLDQEFLTCKAVNPNLALLKKRKEGPINVDFDQEYQEEYDDADLQLFVNDADYTGYNDSPD